MANHVNFFSTNLTSNTLAGATTTPLNSIPTCDAPFYLTLDATGLNSHAEVIYVTSKTATNVNHAATSYAHTTGEEVRMDVVADELDSLFSDWKSIGATLTFSSADAPTFVCTTSADLTGSIGIGMRIKLTHGGSVKYFIVTAIDASTITLYGGTDYTLAATAITLPYFSTHKAPIGFPLSTSKWQVEVLNTGDENQATPTQNTWYNLGTTEQQISIPIGIWNVSYYVVAYGSRAVAGAIDIMTTLSTANNSESDANFTAGAVNTSAVSIFAVATKSKTIALAAKTTYYLNTRTIQASSASIQNFGASYGTTIIRAVCAYL